MKTLLIALLVSLPVFGASYQKDAPDSKMDSALLSAVGQPNFKDGLINMGDRYKQLKLSAAQVKALNSRPILVVSTPGAGSLLVPTAVLATMDYNSATYSSGNSIQLTWGPGGDEALFVEGQFLTSSVDAAYYQQATKGTASLSGYLQKGLYAQVAAADPTTGDSEVFLRVYYRELPGLLTD